VDYTQNILIGRNPFAKEEEEEEARDILKGLVKKVKALRKEVASTKEGPPSFFVLITSLIITIIVYLFPF